MTRRPALGLFGGSFNPPHVGHLIVAEACAEAAGLDRVLWMPAPRPPHKPADPALAPAGQRLALVRAAIEGNPRFEASDLEIERAERPGAGPSYTVDTLRALRARHPEADLALIVGGDSLATFSTWREPEDILALARLVAYPRPGADLADLAPDLRARTTLVDAPLLAVSATDLRARLAAGRSVRYLVPDAVRDEIARLGLYAFRN